MVDDNVDGYNILPVVVEDNNFLMRRERNTRKYNQQLRLQLANEYDTINISATQFPIPAPDPCDYYTVFGYITGGLMTLGANYGNAANIVVNNATSYRDIMISVRDTSNNTPVAGQSYYIRIDYTFSAPSNYKGQGYLALGNTATGGGALVPLAGLQNPGTPIITTAVWGTHPTTSYNYFKLTLPGWSGTSTVSGNIYVTVGFGNCP